MLSWLFKKTIQSEIRKEMNQVNKSLYHSFNNIKKDFSKIHSKVDFQNEAFRSFLKRLDFIEDTLISLQGEVETKGGGENEEIEPKAVQSEWNSLTKLQQDILQMLARLQGEGGKKWISQHQLTEEIYPNKPYDKVRPLISSYISILIEYNFVEKKRVGKQVFLSLNPKSTPYIRDDLKSRNLVKLIKNK